MRPQTSQTVVREFQPFGQRPQSSKLLTQTQWKNLYAQQDHQKIEQIKPQAEPQYHRFQSRNFGLLCDKTFFDSSKQSQLQKFGMSQSNKMIQKNKTSQVVQQVKKVQVYKLIDVDARMRSDPEELTERERELAFKRSLLQVLSDNINPFKDLSKVFNKNSIAITAKLTPMTIRKKQSNKNKKPNILSINFIEAKKLILIKNLLEYFQENMSYQGKQISLDYSLMSQYELIDEGDRPKDFEYVIEQRRFIIELPKLVLFANSDPEKVIQIPLTCLNIAYLIQSNYEQLEQYMVQIDVESNQLMPNHEYPVKIYEGRITGDEKILKRVIYHEGEYCQVSFKPPQFQIMNANNKQIGVHYMSIKQFRQLVDYTYSNQMKLFPSKHIKLVPQANSKVQVLLQFNEMEHILQSQQASACSENGLLIEHTTQLEHKIVYHPCMFEFYNPTTCAKNTRLVQIDELQQIIGYQFNFGL